MYLIISVTAGVLICLTLLVLRLLCHHHHRRPSKSDDQDTDVHETSFQKSNTGETTIPNGFSDDISEIDADIDLTATLPISSLTRNDVSTDHEYSIPFHVRLQPDYYTEAINNGDARRLAVLKSNHFVLFQPPTTTLL